VRLASSITTAEMRCGASGGQCPQSCGNFRHRRLRLQVEGAVHQDDDRMLALSVEVQRCEDAQIAAVMSDPTRGVGRQKKACLASIAGGG
jgi:hypothetical protein